jgi:ATP-dependent DNA helicase RecG
LSTIFLDTPIEYLKGVGPQKADTLKKEIQVFTFGDLLTYFPYRYIDKTKFHTIAEIQGDENFVQIKGSIISVEMLGKERGKRMVATLKDETGTLELVWFKGIKWIASSIKLHEKIIVFGRPSVFNKSIQISHPELEPINVNVQVQLSKFEPMYNSSEKMKLKGLDSKGISKAIKNLLEHTQFSVDDTFPQTLIQKHRFIPLKEAYQFIHFPQTIEQKQKAEFRLKFEELFFIQLKILQSKLFRKINTQGFSFSIVGNCFNEFYNNHLPFELTNAQKRVIKEIRFDIYSRVKNMYNSHYFMGVILGHHKGDLQENIFFNTMKGKNLTDLSVIRERSEILGVKILRLLISHPKSDIFEMANKNNIPYFKNTTFVFVAYPYHILEEEKKNSLQALSFDF